MANYKPKQPPKPQGKSINQEVDNQRFMDMTMELMSFAPLDVKHCLAEVVHQRTLDYFDVCIKFNVKPTVAGYSQALGIGRNTLLDYINGKTIIPLDTRAELSKAYGMLNTLLESYMAENKGNPIAYIFLMKNNFNYKDSSEVVAVDNREGKMTPEALIEESNLMLSNDTKKADFEIKEGDPLWQTKK